MKRIRAFILAGLTAAMLIGCGSSEDDAVVGISIEKLEDIQPVTEEVVEETPAEEEQASEDDPPAEGMALQMLCTAGGSTGAGAWYTPASRLHADTTPGTTRG